MKKPLILALSVFIRKREWNKIIDRGMAMDFSWNSSAQKYADLYNRM